MIEYKGWLPTVTARLSFSEIGNTSHPARCRRANVVVRGRRYIACDQRRNLSDSAFSFSRHLDSLTVFLDRTLLRKEAVYRFVFFGQTESNQNQLSGRVLAYISGSWANDVKHSVRSYCAQLNKIANGEPGDPSAIAYIDHVTSKACFGADVHIERDGLCIIRLLSETATDRHLAGTASGDHADEIASQIYYFLRDIVHNHQHHPPATDTILDVHRVTSDDPDAWKRETSYSLFRSVISARRRKDPRDYYRALGILAYAQAFLEAHCSDDENRPSATIPLYLIEPLKLSIQASSAELESRFAKGAPKEAFNS